MRVLPVVLMLPLLAASSTMLAQKPDVVKPDSEIAPRSIALQRQGEAALAAGNVPGAIDALETAVVADPRNRAAYVGLGRAAQAQGLPGKAIRLYKVALTLEPNDVAALSAEGDALVQRGAVERAKQNLARIQTLCKTACAPATTLAAAIAKGPPPAIQTAQASGTVPPKGQETTVPKPQTN